MWLVNVCDYYMTFFLQRGVVMFYPLKKTWSRTEFFMALLLPLCPLKQSQINKPTNVFNTKSLKCTAGCVCFFNVV